MNKSASAAATRFPADYRRLQQRLGRTGYLSQGSVLERAPGQQGSRYIWTRKLRAKTVTVALSKEQYRWLRRAVANQRRVARILARMQRRSRQILFGSVSGPPRRRVLDKRVLGLI
jgi:hypothetical protein